MGKGKRKVAFDFDGVLNRVPDPFEYFMRHTHKEDILDRAGLYPLKIFFIRQIVARLPFILDGEIFDKIDWKNQNHVISGRVEEREEVRKILSKFPFYGIHMRNTVSVTESNYKRLTIERLGIAEYVEDRLSVIEDLKRAGINVKDVKRWKQ